MVWFADVTVESQPMVVSNFTVPEASGDFCSRGGRFGSHSSNENMTPIYYRRMVFVAFFNAGVRALDIRDPYHPREVGYFIPSITAKSRLPPPLSFANSATSTPSTGSVVCAPLVGGR